MGGPEEDKGRLAPLTSLFQAEEALLQQPRHQQPPQPRPRPVMQQPSKPQQQEKRMTLPPPQGFVGAGMPPQGTGGGFGAVAAARARAAEQMAYEDAWKALNPDYKTSFSSVEDAVSRLLPYHVFADHEEEDDGGATVTEKSSAQKWEDEMNAETQSLLAEFEKQVLTFNVMTRQHAEGINRAEERLMLEKALFEDERRQTESVRAAIAQHQQEQQQEAARARLALAHAQAAAGAWPQAQPSTPSWQQALAAAARGQGSFGEQAMVPALLMKQQQQEMTMTAGGWQALAASRGEGGTGGQAMIQAAMMQQLQQQQQLEMMAAAAATRGEGSFGGQALTPAMVMQLLHQQQQEMMAAGTWQLGGRAGYATPRGDGGSSSHGGLVLQQQPGQGQAAAMALPWRSSAERSEQ